MDCPAVFGSMTTMKSLYLAFPSRHHNGSQRLEENDLNREDFIEALDRCRRKAFLDVTWSFSTDEDEDAKICLDRNGYLIFHDVKTQYNVENVERVKYGIDELNDDYYFLIGCKDGNQLRIGEAKGIEYILLQTGKTDDIYLYRSKPEE